MITKKRFTQILSNAAEQWKSNRKELLSCFDADKLWERLHAYIDLEPDTDLGNATKALDFGEPNKRSIMREVISEETGADAEEKLEAAISLALDRALLTLFDRGALKKLLIVDEVPARAQHDMDLIAANVEAAAPKEVVQVTPPAPPLDPVAQCATDWHSMGSKAFQAKYVLNTNNRKWFDIACERGLV